MNYIKIKFKLRTLEIGLVNFFRIVIKRIIRRIQNIHAIYSNFIWKHNFILVRRRK